MSGRRAVSAWDAGCDLVQCDERNGVRIVLTTGGDAVLYEPERHTVVGVVYGRFEPM